MGKCSRRCLLISASFFLVVLGLGLLWFGMRPVAEPIFSPNPTSSATSSAPIKSGSAIVGVEGERAIVSRVIDGDTIELQNGKTVRLVGIDTPETVDPRRPVGCFGKEASNEAKNLLTNKIVILQKDVSETDKYKRLLRYIYLPLEDGQILFVNDYLVREGFAKVYTYPPDLKFNEQLLQAEKQAREGKKGLWGRC